MYWAVHTRPDMAYTVNCNHDSNHMYLDNRVEHEIVFLNLTDEEPLRAYSNADWARDLDTSRSTTGYRVSPGCIRGSSYPINIFGLVSRWEATLG